MLFLTKHQTGSFFFLSKNILYRNIDAEISEILICSECTRCIFFSLNYGWS